MPIQSQSPGQNDHLVENLSLLQDLTAEVIKEQQKTTSNFVINILETTQGLSKQAPNFQEMVNMYLQQFADLIKSQKNELSTYINNTPALKQIPREHIELFLEENARQTEHMYDLEKSIQSVA